MFYAFEPGKKYYELSYSELSAKEYTKLENEWPALRDKWLSLGWVLDDGSFTDLSAATVREKPEAAALEEAILASVADWQDVVHKAELLPLLNGLSSLNYWHSYVSRLNDIRSLIAHAVSGLPYSSEIIISIVKAVRYMKSTENFRLSRDDASAMVHMSGGYFSQCFKEIVGKPFGDYLQSLQIAKAKKLLRSTKQPIYWIAEQSGYMDEKYFRRIFRKLVGANPADYRNAFKEW
jgi:two-component system response regulator YesN